MKYFVCLLVALIFGTVGFLGIFKSNELQRLMLKYYDNKAFKIPRQMKKWIASKGYILSHNVTGVIGVCGFTFLIFCFVAIIVNN